MKVRRGHGHAFRQGMSGILVPLLFWGFAEAADVSAPAKAAEYAINIEAMPLRVALAQLAIQTGVQLIYRSRLADKLDAPPVTGFLSIEDALTQLLEKTSLTYEFLNEKTVVLQQTKSNQRDENMKNDTQMRRISLAVASVLAAASGLQGTARAAEPATPAVLEEIIVTAERRATSAETTPISMVAISGEQLTRNSPVRNIVDVQTSVPGLTVTNSGSFNFINIRGIGNSSASSVVTSGVAVFLDGLFEPEMQGVGGAMYDIAGIEVLRGPQGTFVGQSSVGGAILINSQAPKLDVVEGSAELTVGNYSQKRFAGAYNAPISDTFAARIAVNAESRDSYYDAVGTAAVIPNNTTSTFNNPGNFTGVNLRASLLWQPSDSFRALLRIVDDKADNDGLPLQPAPGSSFYQFSAQRPFAINNNSTGYQHQTWSRTGLDLQYTFDNGIALRSVSGLQKSTQEQCTDGDASSANATVACFFVTPKEYKSEDLSLVSPTDGRLDWIVGASIFQRESSAGATIFIYPGPPFVATSSPLFSNRTLTKAKQEQTMFYGQVNFDFTDSLQLQVGLRNNGDKTDVDEAGCCVTSSSDSTMTGKVGLNWKPAENQFLYAFYSRGYKAGGANAILDLTNTNPLREFDPETIDDYELGWKGRLFGGRVQMELGGFFMDYKNFQYGVLNPANGRTFTVDNIAKATVKGVEFALRGQLGQLELGASAAYVDSKLGSLKTVAQYLLPAPSSTLGGQCGFPARTTANCFDYTNYYVDLNGGRMPYSPEFAGSLTAAYVIPIGSHSLRPSVTYSYTGRQYASVFQDPQTSFFRLDARKVWDASLNYDMGAWGVQLFGRNLTDEVYVGGFQQDTNVTYMPPRTYGARFSYKF